MTTPSPVEERMARIEGSFEQMDRRVRNLEQDLSSSRREAIFRKERLDRSSDVTNSGPDPLICMQWVMIGAVCFQIVISVLLELL
jgi:hypothetical protein